MLKLNVFQRCLSIKGQKMNLFELSTGETIVVEKIESITNVDHKNGYKGSLYEFTIFMDSGRTIHVSNEDNKPLIKEQEKLLYIIKRT